MFVYISTLFYFCNSLDAKAHRRKQAVLHTSLANQLRETNVFSPKFQINLIGSTNKFQCTTKTEDQGSLTCCCWLFTRRIDPQVEPLLASCCSRLLIFHDWHFYRPNMSYFACCNAPYFLTNTKERGHESVLVKVHLLHSNFEELFHFCKIFS